MLFARDATTLTAEGKGMMKKLPLILVVQPRLAD
jgi:hypothetical protein